MIELPEAVTLARQLNETVIGKTIVRVSAGKTPHGLVFYFGDPAEYPALLEGQSIDAVRSHGGRVELCLGDARIELNDGANLRLLPPGTPEPEKHQLYLVLQDGSALCCAVQMYAAIMACPEGCLNLNSYHRMAHEAPSPLGEEFNRDYFVALRTDDTQRMPVKAFLATEQRIPGLGNGVLQDILWRARLLPRRKINTLSDAEFETLHGVVKAVLREMTDLGGRDTERDLFGEFGGYQTVMGKRNKAMLCPACGGAVCREAYLGGNVYYCKVCQT